MVWLVGDGRGSRQLRLASRAGTVTVTVAG